MQMMFNHFFGVYPTREILPYEIEKDGDTEYWRYTDGLHCTDIRKKTFVEEKCYVFRKTVDGNITRYEKAWCFWKDRKSAEYKPINSPTSEHSPA